MNRGALLVGLAIAVVALFGVGLMVGGGSDKSEAQVSSKLEPAGQTQQVAGLPKFQPVSEVPDLSVPAPVVTTPTSTDSSSTYVPPTSTYVPPTSTYTPPPSSSGGGGGSIPPLCASAGSC